MIKPRPFDVRAAAQAWRDAGYAVLPVKADGTKRPDVSAWRGYTKNRTLPTYVEHDKWFGGAPTGLGLLCGAVSGGLEMFELEGRAVKEGARDTLTPALRAAGIFDLWKRLTSGYAEFTPSGGLHLLYRITDHEVPGNQKIANRPSTPDELAAEPDKPVQGLAETRGDGGFVIVAPSHGRTHLTGEPWVLAGESRYGNVPTVTWEERNALHAVARIVLDQMPEPQQSQPAAAPPGGQQRDYDRPGDAWARQTEWADVLQPHGWTWVYRHGDMDYWRRPGKTIGVSARTGGRYDSLYVWSTSTEFPAEQSITKFRTYSTLDHGGDDRAAGAELRRRGFGADRNTPPPMSSATTSEAPAAGKPPSPTGIGATPFKAGDGYARRFPTDALPEPMRAYVHDIAVRKQVPVDLPALTMIGMIGMVAGPRMTIRRDLDWRQPTNIYTCCGLMSGGGKSPTIEELRKGAYRAKKVLDERHREMVTTRITELRREVEDLRTQANNAATHPDDRITLRDRATAKEEEAAQLVAEPPPLPELMFDGDTSPEQLAERMAANNGAGAIVDDEGTFLRVLGGLYGGGKTGNLNLVLVGYDCRFHRPGRITRKAMPIERAALSLVIAPQPNLIADMTRDQMMDDLGFINRFILCIPGDLIGQREDRPATYHRDEPGNRPGKAGRKWWADLIVSLVDYEVIGDGDVEDAATIDLTRAAFKRHREYEIEIERRLHPETGDLLKIKAWCAKHIARVLRLAAILHLADGKTADDELDETTMANAILIGEWTIEHFMMAGAVSGLSSGAGRIKEYVDGTDMGFCTRNDLGKHVFKGHGEAKLISQWVDELVATKEYVVRTVPTGGRPRVYICRAGVVPPVVEEPGLARA